jgi:hypothetical protein
MIHKRGASSRPTRYVITSQKPEHEKCLIGSTEITKEAWKAEQNTQDNREKLQELSLAKEHKPVVYTSDCDYFTKLITSLLYDEGKHGGAGDPNGKMIFLDKPRK